MPNLAIFQKAKLLIGVLKIKKEASKMDGNKPGWKTTEFWMTLLGTNIPALVAMFDGKLDPKIGSIVLAVANLGYTIMRSVSKSAQTATTAIK